MLNYKTTPEKGLSQTQAFSKLIAVNDLGIPIVAGDAATIASNAAILAAILGIEIDVGTIDLSNTEIVVNTQDIEDLLTAASISTDPAKIDAADDKGEAITYADDNLDLHKRISSVVMSSATIGATYTDTYTYGINGNRALETCLIPNDVTADDDVTIGTKVYTFKAALSTGPQVDGEVLMGADASESRANLVSAINGDSNSGVKYGNLTPAHDDVRAVGGASVTITANVVGVAGNAIALASGFSDGANLWTGGAVLMSGGFGEEGASYNVTIVSRT